MENSNYDYFINFYSKSLIRDNVDPKVSPTLLFIPIVETNNKLIPITLYV